MAREFKCVWKEKDAAYWRRQLEALTTDFLNAQIAEEAVALFDDPQRADKILDDVYENPAELVWPIFHHFMFRAGRVAVFDWNDGPRNSVNEFN